MCDSCRLPALMACAARRFPENIALIHGQDSMTYAALRDAAVRLAGGIAGLGLARGERLAIYLEKRFGTVVASFGAAAAGDVFVLLNPLPKPERIPRYRASLLGIVQKGSMRLP